MPDNDRQQQGIRHGSCYITDDNDGVSDHNDNCTAGVHPNCSQDPANCANFSQLDSDNDGLSDGDEVKVYGTDPTNTDTDSDGLSDGDEVAMHGTDPARDDTDGDRLTDGEEVNTHGTDPTDRDTDDDGILDGDEDRPGHPQGDGGQRGDQVSASPMAAE